MLDVTEKNILLIGAGRATVEKLTTLSQLGKTITVIAPELREEFLDKEWIRPIQRKYREGDLQGFDIVYVGINNSVEEKRILADSRDIRILINFVDQVDKSDFISPASIIRTSFAIFISTFGRAPGAAKKIRKEIENKLDLLMIEKDTADYIVKRDNRSPRS